MVQALLEVRNIRKAYAGVQALDDVSLTVAPGEVHCLVGENGSGKSTLIKTVGGAVQADSGEIIINGTSFGSSISVIQSIRHGIQIIYQDLSLFPNLTVAENISLSQMIEQGEKLTNWKRIREVALRSLAQIEEHIDVDLPLDRCSMAQRQIVAISRALTQGAKLIIMDEPTSAITAEDVRRLFKAVRRLNEQGVAMLFVSHKLNEVFEIADSVTVLRDGKKVGDYQASELNQDKLTFLMSGQNLEYKPFQFDPEKEGAPLLLETRRLRKVNQFHDIDLKIHAGEVVGLTGLVGSGRTELALSLFGLNPPEGGDIVIDGSLVRIKGPEDAKRHGISYLPEDRHGQGLFGHQTIADNVVATVIDSLRGTTGLIDARRRDRIWQEWIDKLKIKTPSGHNLVSSLSGGNQQRVVLAKWLAVEPRVFIIDGPTIGVDVVSKARIHDVIQELARTGMGILVISDEVTEIMQVCSRALVMRKGRIVAEFTDLQSVQESEISQVVAGIDGSEVVA
ncbi:MAG: sugar ABC transporter ATP-binding protein [Spirochaetaceae bacterium]|nr:MAG: sugar ABC transporter ATP-binding protein [Spirochaetaceae bacterium]